MIHEVVSIPKYVLVHAPKYLSDFQFRLMLHTLNVCYKKDWDLVALEMGFENTGPLTAALNQLAEKGIVVIDKYSVSWQPLFDRCLKALLPSYEADEIEVKTKREKKDNQFQILWREMNKIALMAENENKWAKHTLPKLDFTREDILGYAQYIESWHQYKDKNNKVRTKKLWPNVNELKINIQKWIDGGRKERYVPKEQEGFVSL